MKFFAENIPAELRESSRWIGWRYAPADASGRRRKLPIDPRTGRKLAGAQAAWGGGFEAACTGVVEHDLDGVGFVFVEGGGYAGIDFDDCIVDGVMRTEAAAAVAALDSYTEISPGGAGVKVIVRGVKPAGAGCKADGAVGCSRVEVYDGGRYFTVTGRRWPGTPATVEGRQGELAALCNRLWPVSQKISAASVAGPGERLARKLPADDRAQRCGKYLTALPDAVSGQGGHDATLRAACECIRFGLADGEAWEMLQWFNQAKCRPPWTDAALRHKLADAGKKVAADGAVGKRNRAAQRKGKPWNNPLPAWIREIDRRLLKTHKLAILQTIANRCDAAPVDAAGSLGGAIIGFERLACETGMSVRTVKNHVPSLIASGLLVKLERGGIDFKTGKITANMYGIPGRMGAMNDRPDGVQI